MAVAGAALQAVAADDVSLGRHELPDLELGDALSHGHDFARELVADDDRRVDASLRPAVPIGDMQIGAADPRVADRDQHLTRSRAGLGDGSDAEAGGARLLHDGLHCIRHVCDGPGSGAKSGNRV